MGEIIRIFTPTGTEVPNMIEFGRSERIKAEDKDKEKEKWAINMVVGLTMIEQGGLSLVQIREALGSQHSIYLDKFGAEIEGLVEEGLLVKKQSEKEGVGEVLVGNVEREPDPIMTWLDPGEKVIEDRPDLAIIILTKAGKFHSIVLED